MLKEDVLTVAEALKNAQKAEKVPVTTFFKWSITKKMVHNQKNGTHPPQFLHPKI